MVNTDVPVRTRILQSLQDSDRPISGNEIGNALGVSRVAVWKHIQRLNAEGYRIDSRKNGYLLLSEPAFLTPSTPDFDHRKVHVRDEVVSTMTEAAVSADETPRGVSFWIARRQRNGRGRSRRDWASPDGGLYLTALFPPELPAAYCALYTIRAGMDTALFLNRQFGADCRFVWPNDLYCGEKKLGGILLELRGPSERPSAGLLGVGLNISSTPDIAGASATCLQQATGDAEISPRQVFTGLKPVLEAALSTLTPSAVCDRWEQESGEIGTFRSIEGLSCTVKGIALSGSLLLEDESGERYEAAPGMRIIGICRH